VEDCCGEHAEAVESFQRQGFVRVHGEIWNAREPEPVSA